MLPDVQCGVKMDGHKRVCVEMRTVQRRDASKRMEIWQQTMQSLKAMRPRVVQYQYFSVVESKQVAGRVSDAPLACDTDSPDRTMLHACAQSHTLVAVLCLV